MRAAIFLGTPLYFLSKSSMTAYQEGSTVSSHPSNTREKPSEEELEKLVYRSGIPTLRSSAHRVKFSPKGRVHNPRPKNREGEETGTTCLPDEVCKAKIFKFDMEKYHLHVTLAHLLSRCSEAIVGTFREGSTRLEDFVVPTQSTWRSVNGGQCESAQKYLSEAVLQDTTFLSLFDDLVQEVVLPVLKDRLVAAGVASHQVPTKFYYQRPPTLRLQPGPAWAQVKPHSDDVYGHQHGELNFWVPFTDRRLTGVDLYCESTAGTDDFHPLPADVGEIVSFHGSACRHYVNPNQSSSTRASIDFRVGVGNFYDPYWKMKGTTDDHGRVEVEL